MANKSVVYSLCLLALCGLLALSSNIALGATVTTNSLLHLSDRSVAPGAFSTLVRDVDGITVLAITNDLEPGAAHTLWILIFNDPSKCANKPCSPAKGDTPDSVLYAAGTVASAKGKAIFGGRIAVGDTAGALTNPLGAEIHFVIRSHGAAIADMVDAQTGTFNGGCPPNKCENVEGSPHQPFTDDTTARLDAIKKLLDRVARSIPLVP